MRGKIAKRFRAFVNDELSTTGRKAEYISDYKFDKNQNKYAVETTLRLNPYCTKSIVKRMKRLYKDVQH